MVQHVEQPLAGRKFRLETGRLAKQSAGSAVVQFGETMVLAAVTVSDTQSNLPFFPMTVEYREKSYAAGKIPGGFFKREGRPGEEEILAARLIDRSLRPLFPKGFKNEVQVFVYVLSADQENDADVLGITAASLALSLSRVPWNGPIAGVRVGRVEGDWVLNPTFQQLESSDVDLVVSGHSDSIVMVEGGTLEVSEGEIAEALQFAQQGIAEMVGMQEKIVAEVGTPKMEWTKWEPLPEIVSRVQETAKGRVEEALNLREKTERIQALASVRADVADALADEFPEGASDIRRAMDEVEAATMRQQVLQRGERVDGRDMTTVRSINCDVGLLPRAHGSALFTRGQTQALVSTTLGTVSDEQRIDSIDVAQETTKSFMLHYNFPPFSVGEVRPVRGVSRREIGHGHLAERALQALLPPYDEFPYTIRLVSDILESNGSSSMATVCGGSLALMDAGVPLKAPVAGVAMGLVKEGNKYAVLTDILGDEDHLGDMDFKVAGTAAGVTALQMDIKISGITDEIMEIALNQAHEARVHILGEMNKVLDRSRESISENAPAMRVIMVPQDKIRDVIGKGGATIRGIVEETGADIDIEDDGSVRIYADSAQSMEAAVAKIQQITAEAEVGKIYTGRVERIVDFGAFVNILPGKDGLLHISQIADERVENVTDYLQEGQMVDVVVLDVDQRGRIKLSMKEVPNYAESA